MGSLLQEVFWPGLYRRYQLTLKMPKELITIEMERDSLQQKWGFTVQGGADLSLTAKIASVKRFSPADRAGLDGAKEEGEEKKCHATSQHCTSVQHHALPRKPRVIQ